MISVRLEIDSTSAIMLWNDDNIFIYIHVVLSYFDSGWCVKSMDISFKKKEISDTCIIPCSQINIDSAKININ